MGNFERRRLRHDQRLLPIRHQDSHFREMRTLPSPVIDHGEFRQPDGQLRHDDVLKDSHVGEFVAYFETDVIAKERVHQLEFLFLFFLLTRFHLIHRHYPNIFLNSVSSITGTPNSTALSSFDPGSAPATTKSVFLLTEVVTRPPLVSIRARASSRVMPGSDPVNTNCLPANLSSACFPAPPVWASLWVRTPASRRRRHKSLFPGSSNQSRILWAMVNPISWISSSSSTVAWPKRSSEPNCRASIPAVR